MECELASPEYFISSEFIAMDTDGDGLLSSSECARLLTLLGCNRALYYVEDLFGQKTSAVVTKEEYIDLFQNHKLLYTETSLGRSLFKHFDTDGDGLVTFEELFSGSEDLKITLTDSALAAFNSRNDGKITYSTFLRQHFRLNRN